MSKPTKRRTLLFAFLLMIAIAGVITGISLLLQPNQSILGILIIIGGAVLGVAAFLSGLNDTYDLMSKLLGHTEQNSNTQEPVPTDTSKLSDDDSQFLRTIWDRLDQPLQDALSIAYNQSRREGQRQIRTSYVFAAMARLSPEPLVQILHQLPTEALPNPIGQDIGTERMLLNESVELSACVEESLTRLVARASDRKLTSTDVFVDIAKHGTGSSVARLREHGVTPAKVDQLVTKFGWQLVEG